MMIDAENNLWAPPDRFSQYVYTGHPSAGPFCNEKQGQFVGKSLSLSAEFLFYNWQFYSLEIY